MEDKKWLEWAVELQAIAQAGLHYTKDCFDRNDLKGSGRFRLK